MKYEPFIGKKRNEHPAYVRNDISNNIVYADILI